MATQESKAGSSLTKAEIKARDKELNARRKAAKHLYDGGIPSVRGQIAKIIILGIIDAFAGTLFFSLIGKNQTTFVFPNVTRQIPQRNRKTSIFSV